MEPKQAQKLRDLAAWYREFAEKTGNPTIWESRLKMAEDLEIEAEQLEKKQLLQDTQTKHS